MIIIKSLNSANNQRNNIVSHLIYSCRRCCIFRYTLMTSRDSCRLVLIA